MALKEKRRSARVIKRLEVKFDVEGDNTAITSNLSEDGMFIRTRKGATPGSVIDIRLNLPDDQRIYLKGRVVRNMQTIPGLVGGSKSGMGIQLINPSSDYINYVRSLLE